jgi:LPXTG-site transpeptidase (sortase) family protein
MFKFIFHARPQKWGVFLLLVVLIASSTTNQNALAESSVPQLDQTPIAPLPAPNPATASPRYISGFGLDNSYTIFYEDRADTVGCAVGSRIYFNQTTNGPFNLASTSTVTNICDTHLIVKNWPITIGATTYAYRGWGSVGNNAFHTFYVSNNLTNWTQIYYGTGMFSDPGNVLQGDSILYGFHDIIQLNNNYMGFVESAGGHTYMAWSDSGDQNWTLTARVGGSGPGDSPLNLGFTAAGPIPTGNFRLMELDGQLTYGKNMVPGNRSGMYLAINRAAAQASSPAQAEAAFLNPANWTWRDGSIGLPGATNAVLTSTFSSGGHDVREAWTVPSSDPRSDNVILYTAQYASATNFSIGCASSSNLCLVVPAPAEPVVLPATGFAPHTQTSLARQPLDKAYQESGIRLEIPKLGVDLPVVGVPLVDGEWDTSWLSRQAGYLEGTAFPTLPGNTIIAGHLYDYNGKAGPFAELSHLHFGDEIRLHAWGKIYVYEVRNNKLVKPADLSLLKHKDLDWITLLTCQGYDQVKDTYRYRRIVAAVLTKIIPDP